MKLSLFPFLGWLPSIRKSWKNDVLAGILVAVIAVPQGLAYSQMAGMPAHFGLYASFIPLILATLWGSSKSLSTGPAIVISILSLSAIGRLAPSGSAEFISYSATLAIMVGIFQFLMGVFKLGNIVHFISNSVILGFVNASAILILISQFIKILDIPSISGKNFVFSFINFFTSDTGLNLESILIGIFSLIFLIFGKKLSKQIPLALVVIIFATLYSRFFEYSGAVVGEIPKGLPSFIIPKISIDVIAQLIQPAVIVALVAYMNSISVAKTISIKTKEVLSGNQELIGQGLANIAAGFLGSSPVGGSLSRTALNFSTGARSGLASIVTGSLVAVVLLFFTDSLSYVPQTVLAAIIIASVLSITDFKKIIMLFRSYKYDGWVAIFSFFATLFLSPNLELGILIGIIVSGIVYVHRSSYSSILVFRADEIETAKQNSISFKQFPVSHEVLAVSIDRSMIFTNADDVSDKIIFAVNRNEGIKYVMIMCRSVNFIDATAIQVLEALVLFLRQKKIEVIMVSIHPDIWEFLKKLPFYDLVGKENFFKKANEALEQLNSR